MDEKWQESDSHVFLEYGKAFIPYRDKIERIFLDLLPKDVNQRFTVVDICVGGGWLTEAILSKYPQAHVIALDGSLEMLDATENRLKMYHDRLSFESFDLRDLTWMDRLTDVD